MNLKYILAVFIGACSYGILSTIVKLAYAQNLSPAVVTVGQFVVGWLLLLVLFLRSRSKSRLSPKHIIQLMIAGVPTGLVGIFYYLSLVTTEASIAVVLLFQFVWMGTVLDSLVEKSWPNKKSVIAVLIVLVGTILASGIAGGSTFAFDSRGVLFGLLAALSFSLFIMTNAKVHPHVPPIQRSYHMVSGSFVMVVIVFLPQLVHESIASFQELGIFALLLGLFGVVIPPFLFAYGMPHIGSTIGSILGAAELPVAVLCSMLVLNENVSFIQWIGVLMIILAMVTPNIKWRN